MPKVNPATLACPNGSDKASGNNNTWVKREKILLRNNMEQPPRHLL